MIRFSGDPARLDAIQSADLHRAITDQDLLARQLASASTGRPDPSEASQKRDLGEQRGLHVRQIPMGPNVDVRALADDHLEIGGSLGEQAIGGDRSA